MAEGLLFRGHDHPPEEVSSTDDFKELFGGRVDYQPRQQITSRAGSSRSSQTAVQMDGEDDDVLEIESADGLTQFMSLGTAKHALRAAARHQARARAARIARAAAQRPEAVVGPQRRRRWRWHLTYP